MSLDGMRRWSTLARAWLVLGACGGFTGCEELDPDGGPAVLKLLGAEPPLARREGGIAVQLKGRKFQAGAQVHFGTVAAGDVQVMSQTELSLTVPAWTAEQGLVPITIENPDGARAQRDDLFGYYALDFKREPGPRRRAEPRALRIADLNRDGKADLVAVNGIDSTVSVLLGGASLAPARLYAAGSDPGTFAVGDLNGDGVPELALADYNGGRLQILVGRGDGSFATPWPVFVGCTVSGIALVDLDKDGQQDLVMSCLESSANLRYMRGQGGLRFETAVSYQAGLRPTALAVADVNEN